MATEADKIKTQGAHHQSTVGGAVVLTSSARAIVRQTEITHLKEIPNLPGHQRAAKEQSHKWLNDIWPLIINTTADIIDYANTFQATYTQLRTLLPNLKQGNTTSRDEFVHALENVLIPALQEKASASKTAADKIKTFHDAFQPLYSAFRTDFEQANELMIKDNQELRDKQADLNKWHDLFIGLASACGGVMAAMIGTFVGTVVFSGTIVGFAIGGIVMLVEFTAFAALFGTMIDAEIHWLNLQKEVSALHSQVAQLTLIEHQISTLQTQTKTIVDSSANIASGWSTLHAEVLSTIEHLKSVSPEEAASVIENQLAAANTEWTVVLSQARNLQPSGGQIPEKEYATTEDAIKALQKRGA